MKLKHSRKQNYAKFIFVAGIIGIGGLLLAPEFYLAANAEEDNTIDPSKYSVSISSSNTINLNLETVPYTNVIRAGVDQVQTSITAPDSTNAKFGLFVSTDSTTENALKNGTNSIPATSGTFENPVALTGNEWGFALANTTTGLPTPNGFDETYNTPDPGKNSKWAGVPTQGNEQLIQQNLPMDQSQTTTEVYYAVSAKDDLAEGTYTGTVVYTAMYNASETNEMELEPTSGTTDTEITLTTAAVTSMGDPGDVEVKLGDTICPNPTASVTAQGLVQIKCTVPELPATGDYTVTAKLDKTGVTYTANQQFAYTKSLIFNVYYDANGGSGVPSTQTYATTGSETDHTFTLTEGTIPTRYGYTFGGWTEVQGNQAGAYSPGSELYLPRTDSEGTKHNDITLYAIWVPNSEMKFGSLSGSGAKMQNMTSTRCSNVSQGTTGRLQDTRDYKIYYVTKLADNKCWMTQNLALEINEHKTYTSSDTNLPDAGSWYPGDEASQSTYKSTIPYNKLSSSTWKNEYNHQYSYNPGDSYFTTSGTTADETETTSGDPHYASGNLYNWTAAKATNDSDSQTAYASSSHDSICPKGWTLPSANSPAPSDFGTMLFAQGIISSTTSGSYATDGFNKVRTTPLYWVRAGYVYTGGSREAAGSIGSYWSSTASSRGFAYYASFISSDIRPRFEGNTRFVGQSVRCIAL